MRTLEDVLEALPPERREKIEANARKIIAGERALQKLRETRKCTQTTLANAMKTDQARISKIESSSDLMLSTMRDYIEAMGGRMSIVAEFPDGRVEFSALGQIVPAPAPTKQANRQRLRPE